MPLVRLQIVSQDLMKRRSHDKIPPLIPKLILLAITNETDGPGIEIIKSAANVKAMYKFRSIMDLIFLY